MVNNLKLRRLVWPLMAAFMVVALALAACGGDDDDDGGSGGFTEPGGSKQDPTKASGGGGPSAVGSGAGSCEVNITGDMSVSWKGRGGMSAVTADYWYSDDELKKMLEAFKSAKETVDD